MLNKLFGKGKSATEMLSALNEVEIDKVTNALKEIEKSYEMS